LYFSESNRRERSAMMPDVKSRKSEGRVLELDGMRGVAIWMVLVLHILFGYKNPPGALRYVPNSVLEVLGHGWLGVDLFFLLSGFLITGILLETRHWPHYFRNFYIRRFLRIMPLYFTMLAIWSCFYRRWWSYFLLSAVFGANLSSLFHIRVPHGPGVMWSLAIEEQFYLLWPLVVLLLNRRTIFVLCVAIFLGCPLLRGIYAARGMNPEVIYDLSWFRFDGLASGAMLALWASSRHRSRGGRIAAALLCALAILSLAGVRFGLFGTKTPLAVALRYTQAYLAFGAFFILALSFKGTKWTGFLRSRFMRFSGGLSYCLYLVHLSIGDGYVYLFNHQHFLHVGPTTAVFVRSAVILSVSFGLAMLSRKYLEQPMLALKDRFTVSQPPAEEAITATLVQTVG
jgi:peptidoglycan/LPS O-acetylase OafA/YrhL